MKIFAAAIAVAIPCSLFAGDRSVIGNEEILVNDPNARITCPEGVQKRINANFYRELDPAWSPEDTFPPAPGYQFPVLLSAPVVRVPRNFFGVPQQGYASVVVVIEKDGGLGTPQVLCSTGISFEKAAINAMDGAKYSPASMDGEARKSFAIQPFAFVVE